MTWQVLRDLSDLIKEEPLREEVNVKEVERIANKRRKKEAFREYIYDYLRARHKKISEMDREDLAIMTEWLDWYDASMFMDEVKKCLEANRWKPIKWIIENNKSVLFAKR